jgi:hypothetical protein
MKQRHNIQTIAEVLLDELNNLEKLTERVEKATQKPISIDIDPLNRKRDEMQIDFKAFLSLFNEKEVELRKTIEKASKSSEKWHYYLVSLLLFSLIVMAIGIWGGIQMGQVSEITERAEKESFDLGERSGRTEILLQLPENSRKYLENKYPDPNKTFWRYED